MSLVVAGRTLPIPVLARRRAASDSAAVTTAAAAADTLAALPEAAAAAATDEAEYDDFARRLSTRSFASGSAPQPSSQQQSQQQESLPLAFADESGADVDDGDVGDESYEELMGMDIDSVFGLGPGTAVSAKTLSATIRQQDTIEGALEMF